MEHTVYTLGDYIRLLEERDLLEQGAMVVNCGLPGEQVYPTLADKPDSTGYFTTLIIP